MSSRILPVVLLTVATTVGMATFASAGSVTGPSNKHNLSVSGPGIAGLTKSTTETRVCIFCHTPHHANVSPEKTPLWTKKLSDKTYDLYVSDTLRVSPQQPTGSSRLCLSCHDGTIALGVTHTGSTIGGLSSPLTGRSNLGDGSTAKPDLSNDHPFSFVYPDSLSEIMPLAALPPEIRTENGSLQCISCHDPHDDQFANFLVKDNDTAGSPLCTTCHLPEGWSSSTHKWIDFTYPASALEGARRVYGCEGCHTTHGAPQSRGLLRGENARETCTRACHNGSLPTSQYGRNVESALGLGYTHNVGQYPGVHSGNEDPLNVAAEKHVECFDCHNPHRVTERTAVAPAVSGSLEGVKVQKLAAGDFRRASTEYDVCYKCHSESWNSFRPAGENLPERLPFDEHNQQLRFITSNASYHPVMDNVDPARITTLDTLKSSYTARNGSAVTLDLTTMIYCHDCHDPHGSVNQHLLAARYQQDTSGIIPYSSADYALCYKCHDDVKLMDETSSGFRPHRLHVVTGRIPCSACHDPHGVQTMPHLINFDTRPGFVNPTTPPPVYNSLAKSCTVSCHGTPGNTYSYTDWVSGASAGSLRKRTLPRPR